MKTIPPTCPEAETGRRYWRSLDQLAETPEFREWVEREFPAGASEWSDPVSRRKFVKIMSASFMLAGLGFAGAGCRRPLEKLEPFGKQPEDYVYGVPQYYATAMPTRDGAIPLAAKSYEGRPIKVEGNALYPGGNGGTDTWAQASILNVYDPDRSRRLTKNGTNTTPEAAFDFLSGLSRQAQANGGQGLAFLIERNSSPTRQRLQKIISQKFPRAKWFVHEPIDTDIHRRAASEAFGASVKPYFKYDAAKVIVSLDCDFVGSEENAHQHIRGFSAGRRLEKPDDSMSRLYVVESLFTLTGLNADHRLRIPTSAVASFAQALNAALSGQNVSEAPEGVDVKWISECAKDLLVNKGKSLVVAGHRQPLAVHLLAHAMNSALGNIGKTVVFHEAAESREGNLAELAEALNGGQVETLVMLGGNPAYNAPANLNWTATQRKAKTVVRLGYYEDESFIGCDWHFPQAHYLESWGDARTSDGTLVPVQPLIAPLFGGLTEIEVLARIAGLEKPSPYVVVRETFGQISGNQGDEAWRKFLYNGFLENSAAKPANVRLNSEAISRATGGLKKVPPPDTEHLEVIFHRDYSMDDGRYNNNGWLQELPDPITKVTWDNVVLISRKTAGDLGLKNNDVVRITVDGRTVEGPIWIQLGQADNVLGLALGYGRTRSGRVGMSTGFNAYLARPGTADLPSGVSFLAGATVAKTGESYPISCTQNHWTMEGRPVIREANIEEFRKRPDFAKSMHPEEPPVVSPLYPNPFDKVKGTALHQWGMSIDLNACVGCSACMIACQSENNIPIVGKDQVNRGREMHWIRIDRYYTGSPKKEPDTSFAEMWQQGRQPVGEGVDDPQAVVQPMLCQMCEAAPCENVCPVNATTHDQEGLNVMVYNRCVGTRYCSNNCPYKVRRFNYLDFNKRSIKELKGPFYPPFFAKGAFAKWVADPTDPTAGMRNEDEWDLIKMSKNPDVTVRMRGVMEKCTFCIQRIQQAKIAQKDKAGQSGDVIIPDGTFTTACAQACPADAIVFGNIADPESRVAKLKKQQRDYSVLEFLLTKPRLTYLARIRNPNPRMPDYTDWPLSFEEYEQRNGDPFEHAEATHGEAEKTGAHE
ncbi:MAG TPA: TAT-variant-translocated molybdopterin oxidoreductase [Verrucomicrobiae bacterium]|nr:TAT-variant-translocated molybdopterin oxidoreductase [Verrucomicrobiae bacterium]